MSLFDRDDEGIAPAEGGVVVVVPVLSARARRGGEALASSRAPEAKLQEAVGLAAAIGLDVRAAEIVTLNDIKPATLIGGGKVEEIAGLCKAHEVRLVFVDAGLSPVQQRNLEKALDAKVIDRTGLILEIFGQRARTKEGALQVELAHLTYQKSRLVRSWTHLERQRGGFGFLGGPGETQIEADRRMIQERMTRIEKDLDQVKRTRRLHRAGRKRVPFPVIALVGYTNAGKSTLFNRLTRADVLAQDLLFATLDPTLRLVRLPGGTKAILSDTVGFISDLPTLLVAAFRATLEEVLEADAIVHVRDLSSEQSDSEAEDVRKVLGDLDVAADDARLVEAWNKIDLLDDVAREELIHRAPREEAGEAFPVSAVTGEGLEALLSALEERLSRVHRTMSVELTMDEGALQHWIYENASVLDRSFDEERELTLLTLRISPDKAAQLEARLRARMTG